MKKVTREFYTRPTLLVARALLGMYLVRRLPSGEILRGKIVETEAYAGRYDPGSHTYQDRRTERNALWYGEGGYAYVYQIYGCYYCLGIITEPRHHPGAVLIRAIEPTDDTVLLFAQSHPHERPERCCAGPSKLCRATQIDARCDGLDLCGDELFLEEGEACSSIEDILFSPRINIDYAGAAALWPWRYVLRGSPAISKRSYEPLRDWRRNGYPSLRTPRPFDLITHLRQQEEQTMNHGQDLSPLQALPKVELHLHLEGCLTPATLRTLCRTNRKPLSSHLLDDETHYFGTFDEFVYAYHGLCQALVHEHDFALVIADIATYLKRHTILYAEVSWTPFLYLNRGLRFEAIMEVMNEALVTYGIADRVNFVIDIQRDHGLEAGAWVYQQVFAADAQLQIVGVGLTGQEEGFPPAEFESLYHQAHERGLGTTAHAGEYGSAEDIWRCVRTLGVSRIGHGIRAVQDRELMQYLATHRLHLEICPTSNVCLERVPTYSAHPVQALKQAGIPLGLNSDNPGLLSCGLSEEYRAVMTHCGFTLADIHQSIQHSVEAAFLPVARRQELQHAIDQEWRPVCSSV